MNDPLNIVQNAYACFGRGDIPALLQHVSEDITWQFVADRGATYTATVHGHAQLAEWFGCVAALDDIQAFEPREFLVGADHVTVLGFERTTARATGRSFECEWVHVWRVHESRITRFYGILDSEAAAAARR